MSQIKKVEIIFPDDFTPPKKFQSMTDYDYSVDTICEQCPFYFTETYEPNDGCMLIANYDLIDICPLNKYFKDNTSIPEGEWVSLGDYVLSCSVCGSKIEDPGSEEGFNFCPWCGSKMNPVINRD